LLGIGQALLEQTEYDRKSGRMINANLGEYLLPVHADVPEIDVAIIDEPDLIVSPVIGAKGVGEIGIVGVAAAIGNAIFNATGVRIGDLPILPEKLGV
jgi:xanthine dehydrogenase YagR molybdenum-binding subunit